MGAIPVPVLRWASLQVASPRGELKLDYEARWSGAGFRESRAAVGQYSSEGASEGRVRAAGLCARRRIGFPRASASQFRALCLFVPYFRGTVTSLPSTTFTAVGYNVGSNLATESCYRMKEYSIYSGPSVFPYLCADVLNFNCNKYPIPTPRCQLRVLLCCCRGLHSWWIDCS